jgi:proline iminopeptidase
VLIVTAAHAGFNARARQTVAERGTAEQQAVCAQLWAGALRTEEQLRHYYDVMGPMYALRHDPAAAAATRTRGVLAPDAINRAFAPGGFLQTFDLRPELPRIAAPTLVLAGRHDWICPPEFSQEIARLIPGSRLRIFEHSSHSIRVDEPEAMVEEIRRFVAAEPEPKAA